MVLKRRIFRLKKQGSKFGCNNKENILISINIISWLRKIFQPVFSISKEIFHLDNKNSSQIFQRIPKLSSEHLNFPIREQNFQNKMFQRIAIFFQITNFKSRIKNSKDIKFSSIFLKTNLMIMLPVESCRTAIGVFYFRHGKHVHKKNNCTSKFLAKIKKLTCLLNFFYVV